MSRPYAWRVLGCLPILKGAACTNTNKEWQSQRRLALYHAAMAPIIDEINEICSNGISCELGVRYPMLQSIMSGDKNHQTIQVATIYSMLYNMQYNMLYAARAGSGTENVFGSEQ